MTRLIARIGATLAAVVVTVAIAATPAHAAPTASPKKYAALGDSYSAGVGTGSPENGCFQSEEGYPALIADWTGWDLQYLACVGADVAQVTGQVSDMAADTDAVTLTAGGNDAGFSPVLTACAGGTEVQCTLAIQQYDSQVLQRTLPDALDGLYRAVRAKAPNAKVVVVGYPRLFDYRDCLRTPDGLHISVAEQALMNAYGDRLNLLIESRARANGLQFADATWSFSGHAVCSNDPWINGFLPPPRTFESFHPNDAGNVGYARLVGRKLGVAAVADPVA